MKPGLQKVHSNFLKIQFAASGISNAFLNCLAFYIGNRSLQPVSHSAAAIDAFITCGFISLLVTFPTAYFTGKALKAGLPVMERNRWVYWLPGKTWLLWLTLWLLAVVVMEMVFAGIYLLGGIEEITFFPMLLWRFCWCGLLGGTIGVLVGTRCLQPTQASK